MAQPILIPDGMGRFLPKSVAQLTGVMVTGIVTFGTDLDAIYSVPLGVFAGALAMFFVAMAEARETYRAHWGED